MLLELCSPTTLEISVSNDTKSLSLKHNPTSAIILVLRAIILCDATIYYSNLMNLTILRIGATRDSVKYCIRQGFTKIIFIVDIY